MATNGYTRCCCKNCLFYEDLGYKKECTLYYDDARADILKPLYYSDCKDNRHLYDKFFENCEHQVRIDNLKNTYRKKFGIKMYDYGV